MKIVLTGFASIEGCFIAKKHVVAALESANHEVLASIPKDLSEVLVAEGKAWGGKPASLVAKAHALNLNVVPLGELLTPEVMDGLKSVLEAAPHLESTEKKLLESLRGEPTVEQLEATEEELKAKVTPRNKKTTSKKRRVRKEVKTA